MMLSIYGAKLQQLGGICKVFRAKSTQKSIDFAQKVEFGAKSIQK
jgi:hypothetical protein